MMFSLSVAASLPLYAAHGNMNYPPTWHDRSGYWQYNGGQCAAGCVGEKATRPSEGCVCEVYSNYTFIPGEPTIPPKSPLLTYQDACQNGGVGSVAACCTDACQDPKNQETGGPCEGCDWNKKNPWRAPGSAPVWSPCGFDGGNPEGCPPGNPDWQGCNGGGYGHGPDSRLLPDNRHPVRWVAGSVEEVSWGFTANHGGGYQYRLCPKPEDKMDLTEECFQKTPLAFVGSSSWLQNHTDETTRVEIPAVTVTDGVVPAGSTWRRMPIPACGGMGGGSNPKTKDCTGLGTQFPPPLPGVEGFHASVWNMIDKVQVPDLPAGKYVIGFRYDCEQTSQVWQQCGDIILEEAPPSPAPSPSPSGCPGGSFDACIKGCPSSPKVDFQACVTECQKRCDSDSVV